MYESLDTAEHGRGAPSPLLSMAELPRTLCEAAGFGQFWPLLTQAPQGDGHPVLVLPGFTASDASTLPLRRFLDRLGYRTLPWEVGTNTGSLEVQVPDGAPLLPAGPHVPAAPHADRAESRRRLRTGDRPPFPPTTSGR